MSSAVEAPETDPALATPVVGSGPYVGLLTRALSWVVDLALVNLVAVITGLGVLLVVSVFPITKHLQPLFDAIAGGVYILWTAVYFVAFWSVAGQTPGSRLMEVRLVTPNGGKAKPARAFVRWIAMNLAMLPLPWGYLPIPFKRLGFPDWLAHTRVIDVEAQQQSVSAQRLDKLRGPRNGSRATAPPATSEITDDQ